MNILSTYVYEQYLLNVQIEARKFVEVEFKKQFPDVMSSDELESWIYYLSMSRVFADLEIYLMDNYPRTSLEYLLERHEKDSIRYANTPSCYILSEYTALHVICYNAELLYELDNFEQTLTIDQTIHILTKVLRIEISNHEIAELALLSY